MWATVIRVLMVSMFFCFISAMPELAVSRVNLASACTYASLSNCSPQTKREGSVSEYCTARDTVRQPFGLQYLYAEDARYPDGTADPLQTQRGHLGVVAVLKTHAESGQEGCPRQLRNNGVIRFYSLCVKLCTSLTARVCPCPLVLP